MLRGWWMTRLQGGDIDLGFQDESRARVLVAGEEVEVLVDGADADAFRGAFEGAPEAKLEDNDSWLDDIGL